MVYAVASGTLQRVEAALGRRVRWRRLETDHDSTKETRAAAAVCARALDCCPPVDITFGDFLRAVLTSDLDFHPDDRDGVRDALMQAFRLRGIVADEVASFSEDSLGRRSNTTR
jgi:hypothetical protein